LRRNKELDIMDTQTKLEKTMTDAAGAAVPVKYVKSYDKRRDLLARRIRTRWEVAQLILARVYRETAADVAEIEKLAASGRTGARGLGVKGNFQFQSFDGLIQVSRAARYEIRFDERLKSAQEIIEGIIREKTEAIDSDIAEMLRGVFRPTSDGLLSQARVMGLFRLKISHPRWSEAMDLIRESIESRKGKTLFSVRSKASRESEWKSIELDIADCDPQETAQEAI